MSGKPLSGDKNQCRGCLCYFRSTFAFDKHRIGAHGIDRRCMSTQEMVEAGMVQKPDGFWVSSAMPDAIVSRHVD